jgi:hypothetical protein
MTIVHDTKPTLHLSDYVALSLADILEVFDRGEMEGIIASSVVAALGEGAPELVVATADPEVVSGIAARVNVLWSLEGDGQDGDAGSAVVTLLVVQSGDEPLTELLLTLPQTGGPVELPPGTLRRLLDEVTRRLLATARVA